MPDDPADPQKWKRDNQGKALKPFERSSSGKEEDKEEIELIEEQRRGRDDAGREMPLGQRPTETPWPELRPDSATRKHYPGWHKAPLQRLNTEKEIKAWEVGKRKALTEYFKKREKMREETREKIIAEGDATDLKIFDREQDREALKDARDKERAAAEIEIEIAHVHETGEIPERRHEPDHQLSHDELGQGRDAGHGLDISSGDSHGHGHAEDGGRGERGGGRGGRHL